MAKVDAATFKAAMDLAAVELTTAMQDDTLTELAVEYKTSLHPARNVDKLFILNKATGVYTTSVAYIDSFYAGNFPGAGKLVDGQGTPTPIAVVTATVEDAAAANIVLTFDRPVFENAATAVSIAGVVTGDDKVITGIVYAGTVVTVTVDTPYIMGDTITLSGRFFGNHNNYIDLAAQVVTNNVT